jgi:hypothetical protein
MGPHYEDVVDSTYLDDFTTKWSVGLSTYKSTFLNSRSFVQVMQILGGKKIIQIETVY